MEEQQRLLPVNELSVRMPLVRRGNTDDVNGVLLLESRYFIGNLTAEQRKAGFISILQPEGWFARIAAEGGLHVAIDGQQTVVGFIVVAPPLHGGQTATPPIVERMVALADTVEYRGRRISSYRYALRGPVCIDERFRGHGLYDAFNAATDEAYRGTYELGMLFVSDRNSRSLRTTTTKLKATPLAIFDVGGERYHYLVYEFGASAVA